MSNSAVDNFIHDVYSAGCSIDTFDNFNDIVAGGAIDDITVQSIFGAHDNSSNESSNSSSSESDSGSNKKEHGGMIKKRSKRIHRRGGKIGDKSSSSSSSSSSESDSDSSSKKQGGKSDDSDNENHESEKIDLSLSISDSESSDRKQGGKSDDSDDENHDSKHIDLSLSASDSESDIHKQDDKSDSSSSSDSDDEFSLVDSTHGGVPKKSESDDSKLPITEIILADMDFSIPMDTEPKRMPTDDEIAISRDVVENEGKNDTTCRISKNPLISDINIYIGYESDTEKEMPKSSTKEHKSGGLTPSDVAEMLRHHKS